MGSIQPASRRFRRAHFQVAITMVVVTILSFIGAPQSSASTEPETFSSSGEHFCNGLRATIVGTPGDDVLIGTSGRDVILGRGGNDIIRAGTGDDVVCGGGGDDKLRGGGGDDWLDGDSGYDVLSGGSGADTADDADAKCRAETIEGCREPLPEALTPQCGRAPKEVVQAIHAAFHDTPHVCYFADTIAYRESRWTPTAIGGPNRNGTYDYGLLQLNSGYIRTWAEWAGVDWNDWNDPFVNAEIARALYDRAGEIWNDPLRPWDVRR